MAQRVVSFCFSLGAASSAYYSAEHQVLALILLLRGTVQTDNDSVVTLVWLQGHLLFWLELGLLEFLHLTLEHLLGSDSGVDAIGLDGDDKSATVLQKVL